MKDAFHLDGKPSITATGTEMRSYYGRPIVKEPVWTWEIPAYFFTGGLAGASSVLSSAARLAGNEELARTSLYVGAVADLVSPALLISDLGRPERFHHMLRVVKVTSPMNLGSWVLLVSGGASRSRSRRCRGRSGWGPASTGRCPGCCSAVALGR